MMLQRARNWAVLGAAATVVILALSWLFIIKPQQSNTADLKSQAATEAIQIVHRQHELADLRKQNDDLSAYKAALAQDQLALPSTDGVPDFLRALQAIGVKAGVTVTTIAVQDPAPAAADGSDGDASVSTGSSLYEVVMSLVVNGSPAGLTAFLHQVQTAQPRAVLITVAGTAPNTQGTAKGLTLNLTAKVFVSSSAGVAAPAAGN
jgi:Tfp pilus assembly protein PilO